MFEHFQRKNFKWNFQRKGIAIGLDLQNERKGNEEQFMAIFDI